MQSIFFDALCAFGIVGFFVAVGVFFVGKFRFLQRFFVPASVVGGIFAFFFVQVAQNFSLFEQEIQISSCFASVLVVPVFAATGFSAKKSLKKGKSAVLMTNFALFSACGSAQLTAGFGFAAILSRFAPNLLPYKTFGYELSQGFAGGHGTAGAVGNLLSSFGFDFWQAAQGVTSVFATAGLVGGIFFGLLMIRRQKGEPKIFGAGEPQAAQCDECEGGNPLLTVSLILFSCAAAIFLSNFLKQKKIPVVSSIPAWPFAMLFAKATCEILCAFHAESQVSQKTARRVSQCLSDFAICASLATLPVKAIARFLPQIAVLCAAGFLLTYFMSFAIFPRFFSKDDFAFERALVSWGVNTGVLMTGIALLRSADSKGEAVVLADFSQAFSMMCACSAAISPATYFFLQHKSAAANFAFSLSTVAAYLLAAALFSKKSRGPNWRKS